LIPSGIDHVGGGAPRSDAQLAKPISIDMITIIFFIEFPVVIIVSSFLGIEDSNDIFENGQFEKGSEERPQRDIQNPPGAIIGVPPNPFFHENLPEISPQANHQMTWI
jgi:hypothetical protein